jgi:hypothetical protein
MTQLDSRCLQLSSRRELDPEHVALVVDGYYRAVTRGRP